MSNLRHHALRQRRAEQREDSDWLERRVFEAWLPELWEDFFVLPYPDDAREVYDDGQYRRIEVQAMWVAWRARGLA